ncbi:MAG: hypothetical protein ACN4GZ_05325 [Acidimicrobiales bacterium]
MFGPKTATGGHFRWTSTRSRDCWKGIAGFPASVEGHRDPSVVIDSTEQMLERLQAELQAWLNHPSASTWSQPQKDND